MNDIQMKIIEFREKRNWEQFHSTKDLCLGLNIEVAELQTLFLWKSDQEIKDIIQVKKEQIEDELADIFIFLTYLANDMKIDIVDAVEKKIKKNEQKYPIDKSFGSNKKYSEL